MGSILKETKQMLGLDAEAEGFDPELILFINGVLSELTQLGIGPDLGFSISDATATWETFLGSDPRLNDAKLVMYYGVKLTFDPPQTGPLGMSLEKLRNETIWRLNVAREEIIYPYVPPVVDVEDGLVLDGGDAG